MEITVAKNSGFCPGVNSAAEAVEALLSGTEEKREICVIGELIHNGIYNQGLYDRGVLKIEPHEAAEYAKKSDSAAPCHVFIRAHGVTEGIERELRELEEAHPNFHVHDMTCPFVRRIHKIAEENTGEDTLFIFIGTKNHPETEGILSHAKGTKAVFSNSAELIQGLEKIGGDGAFQNKGSFRKVIAASQTTQNTTEWKKSQEIIKKVYTNAVIFDTICSVTEIRQTETAALSEKSDAMIIIGGKNSSNTEKLYYISKERCDNTIRIESAKELRNYNFSTLSRIGIAAGASTPSGIIKEVVQTMEDQSMIETESFEDMIEATLKTLNTGDLVNCMVTSVTPGELRVDLGAKVTGVIARDQITDDTNAKLEDMFKVGDEFKAFVIKVSDIEGIATLSKKRADLLKNWDSIVEASESGETLEGTVTDSVRGGVLVLVNDVKVYVPARHSGLSRETDLGQLVGKKVRIKIIEINKQKRHAYASIRAARDEERKIRQADEQVAKEAFFADAKEGDSFEGKVKNLTNYGAFVEIAPYIVGMVHKDELSWKRIKHPSEVVSVGDVINVFVKSLDPEKGHISLGYKTPEMNNWYKFAAEHNVGDVIEVKVVSMLPFGAFAEIIDGVEGLIPISQISYEKIGKPSEVLQIGEVLNVKIIQINEEKQEVSLSRKALLERGDFNTEEEPESAEV